MILYGGICITENEARKVIPGIKVAGPVKRGELYTDFEKGHRVFLIADGEFSQNLAVTVGEMVDVIRSGAQIFGSSSMGALRAAEIDDMSVQGCGKIYDVVQNVPFFRDDWVGHLYSLEPRVFFTMPFIEFLFLFHTEINQEILTKAERFFDRYVVNFEDLTHELCLKLIPLYRRQAPGVEKKVQAYFEKCAASQKTRDALLMLKTVRQWQRKKLQSPGVRHA